MGVIVEAVIVHSGSDCFISPAQGFAFGANPAVITPTVVECRAPDSHQHAVASPGGAKRGAVTGVCEIYRRARLRIR